MQKLEISLIIAFVISSILLYFQVPMASLIFIATSGSLGVGYFNWFYDNEIKFMDGLVQRNSNSYKNKPLIERLLSNVFRTGMAMGFISILFKKMDWPNYQIMIITATITLSAFLISSLLRALAKRKKLFDLNFIKAFVLLTIVSIFNGLSL